MSLSSRDVSPVTGLSVQEAASGSPTTLASGNFVPVLELTNLQHAIWVTGATFTFSGGPNPVSPTYRFKAKISSQDLYVHFAPYDTDGQDLVNGQADSFRVPLQLPRGASLKVEVGTTSVSGGTQVTAELSVVRFKP